MSCILVGTQGLVLASVGYRTPGPVVSEFIQLALGFISIFACIGAFQRSHSIARNVWRLLGLAFLMWAVAQGLGVYIDISGDHLLDSLDDLLFFASIFPFGMLPFLDPEGEPTSFDRLHILDFIQVGILSVSIFLCFTPKMWSPATGFRVGPFTWSRNISFEALVVATFLVRALLTKSKGVRSLFGRMGIFLLLSGLADSYALDPRKNLAPGGFFDLIWSGLLAIPILIAATWKNASEGQTDPSAKSESVAINQVFPLLYPIISFFIQARVGRAYPLLSSALFVMAVIAFAARVLIIQKRQRESQTKLLLEITERERTQQVLRQSELGFRLLFESNPLPMWVFDRKTLKFLAVNEAACRQYGFSSQEFLTMTIADIRPEEDIPDLLEVTANPGRGFGEASFWRHRKKTAHLYTSRLVATTLIFMELRQS